jgi:pimeloyl-ACP methyl ester carboxylesterase
VSRKPPQLQFVTIHGHRRAFVKAGRGPAVLLLHGLGCDHSTWDSVIAPLACRYTVIAPDLLGHGQSDKPRADYSVAGYANGMRDLLTVLGIDRATVVGHSLGGGIATQFAYQFPERTERLVLVAAGGLGPQVTPFIRAVGTPGFHQIMGALTLPGVRHLGVAVMRALAGSGLAPARDLDEAAEVFDSLKDPAKREAIRYVVGGVIDWRGQIVTMADRAYLLDRMPVAVVWGSDDLVLPTHHTEQVTALVPHARVEVLPNSGHFPHKDHPERFVHIVNEFMRETKPWSYSRERTRALLKAGPKAPKVSAVEAAQESVMRFVSGA